MGFWHVKMLELAFNCTNVIFESFVTTLLQIHTILEHWKSEVISIFTKHPLTFKGDDYYSHYFFLCILARIQDFNYISTCRETDRYRRKKARRYQVLLPLHGHQQKSWECRHLWPLPFAFSHWVPKMWKVLWAFFPSNVEASLTYSSSYVPALY